MTTYAKLIAGQPRILAGAHNIANATEAQLAEYAAAHGYKTYTESAKPGLYWREAYFETDTALSLVLEAWPLEDAKADALQRVQEELTAALSERVTIPCAGIENGVISDNDALFNAAGDFRGAPSIVDAANELHEPTPELQEAYKTALAERRNGLYALATYRRALIDAAADVDAVEAALTATPNPES